jgi:O-antigen/teichoic acid export membrane protein
MLTLIGLAASQGITILVLIMVARHATPVEFGQYLACYALASLLVVLPNYGLETWLLAQGETLSHHLSHLWHSAIRLRILLLMPWIIGMIALGLFLPADAFPFNMLLPTVLGVACDSLSLISHSVFRSMGWYGRVTVLQLLAVLGLLGLVVVLPLGPDYVVRFSIGRALISASLTVLITILACIWLGGSSIGSRGDPLRTAHVFLLSDLAVAVYLKADLVIVSLILGSSGSAVYGPALNLINLSFLIPNALYLTVMPTQARVYLETGKFGWIGFAQLGAQGLVGIVLSVIFFLFAQPLIHSVFGPAYEPVAMTLGWLFPIPFLKSLNFGLALLLTASGYQRWRTMVQTLCALFNIVANLIVVVPFGVIGVSRVYVFSESMLLLGYALGVGRCWIEQLERVKV